MIAILETDNPVRLQYLKMVLEAADLHPFVFQPAYRSLASRLLVPESEAEIARHLLVQAERDLPGDDGQA